MNHQENTDAEGRSPLTSEKELEEAIQSTEKQEQLYSIALFDILGFSNFVECNGTHVIMELYQKLLDLIHPLESQFCRPTPHVGSVVPVPMSPDWKYSQLVADGNGYVRTCHFSDTFIIYVSYLFQKGPWLLRDTLCEPHPLLLGPQTEAARLFYGGHHIYLSFLQICMEFFCQAVGRGGQRRARAKRARYCLWPKLSTLPPSLQPLLYPLLRPHKSKQPQSGIFEPHNGRLAPVLAGASGIPEPFCPKLYSENEPERRFFQLLRKRHSIFRLFPAARKLDRENYLGRNCQHGRFLLAGKGMARKRSRGTKVTNTSCPQPAYLPKKGPRAGGPFSILYSAFMPPEPGSW